MTKISFIIMAAVAALLASCGKDSAESAMETDSNEIRFEVGMLGTTKANEEAFETGDNISLYAVEYTTEDAPELMIGGNYLNNEKLSFDGTAWKGANTLYWSEKPCDFYAMYPYIKPTSVESFVFEVATDQNSAKSSEQLGGYEMSDLLFAKSSKVRKEDGKVDLKFTHLMSKCVVNVVKGEKFEGELPDDISVHIYNTTTTAILNIAGGSVEKYAFGDKKTITMKKLSNDKFAAVVVPQNLERRTPLIEITMGGIAYLLEYSLSFKPGYVHNINLVVNTSPDQEKIEITIDPNM